MTDDSKRPMNHFFDDDLEHGEELNRDAWLEGKTDSDLEREADEFNEYCDAMQYDSDGIWDADLPDDARDLPPGFPISLLEEPYHAPLSQSLCLEIFERMVQRQRAREDGQQADTRLSVAADQENISDHEEGAVDGASEAESPHPETPPLLANATVASPDGTSSRPDRRLKSTRKRRDEQNAVRRKPKLASVLK